MAFDPLPPANSIAAYSDKPVRSVYVCICVCVSLCVCVRGWVCVCVGGWVGGCVYVCEPKPCFITPCWEQHQQ